MTLFNPECSMKSFILQKSANNEVRVGWQDLPRRSKKHDDAEDVKKEQYYAQQVALAETDLIRVGSRGYLIDRVNGCSVLTYDESSVHEAAQQRSLDIIRDFQESRKRRKNDNKPGWGNDPKVTAFGKYARHTLLEAGAVASRGAGHLGRGVEVTLTIPGHSLGAFRAVSQWSGYLVNRILQAVRDYSKSVEWFYVWEIQKRGALHLHLALSGESQRDLLRLGRKIRRRWYWALEEVGRKSGVNIFFNDRRGTVNRYKEFLKGNRVAEIRKSLAAYFAKYVSKGASKDCNEGIGRFFPPARWWGISRKLLAKVKAERLNVRITCVSENELVGLLSSAIGYVRRYNPCRNCSYSFDVSYGNGSDSKQIGFGQRFIYWFDDRNFSSLNVWLPQLLRYLSAQCSNAVIEGDIDWALHTPAWR